MRNLASIQRIKKIEPITVKAVRIILEKIEGRLLVVFKFALSAAVFKGELSPLKALFKPAWALTKGVKNMRDKIIIKNIFFINNSLICL